MNKLKNIPTFENFYSDFKENEKNVNEIRVSVAELRVGFKDLGNAVNEGFKGIHKRQDITNGNVRSNTRWRWMLVGGMILLSTMVLPIILTIVNTYIERWLPS